MCLLKQRESKWRFHPSNLHCSVNPTRNLFTEKDDDEGDADGEDEGVAVGADLSFDVDADALEFATMRQYD